MAKAITLEADEDPKNVAAAFTAAHFLPVIASEAKQSHWLPDGDRFVAVLLAMTGSGKPLARSASADYLGGPRSAAAWGRAGLGFGAWRLGEISIGSGAPSHNEKLAFWG